MLSLESLVMFVIYLIVAGLIFGLLIWLIDFCGTPEPFRRIARVVLAIFAVLVVIGALLSLVGHPLIR